MCGRPRRSRSTGRPSAERSVNFPSRGLGAVAGCRSRHPSPAGRAQLSLGLSLGRRPLETQGRYEGAAWRRRMGRAAYRADLAKEPEMNRCERNGAWPNRVWQERPFESGFATRRAGNSGGGNSGAGNSGLAGRAVPRHFLAALPTGPADRAAAMWPARPPSVPTGQPAGSRLSPREGAVARGWAVCHREGCSSPAPTLRPPQMPC